MLAIVRREPFKTLVCHVLLSEMAMTAEVRTTRISETASWAEKIHKKVCQQQILKT
jgi:hypothetical protein